MDVITLQQIEQPSEFTNRAAAKQAFEADNRGDFAAHQAEKAAWWRDLAAKVAKLPAPLAAIGALHMPTVPDAEDSNQRVWHDCGECDNGAPCGTLHLVLTRLPAKDRDPAAVPSYSPTRVFEDYWIDPAITVTFAHPCRIEFADGTKVVAGPEDTVTMKLTSAERCFSRLIRSSMLEVDALAGTNRTVPLPLWAQ